MRGKKRTGVSKAEALRVARRVEEVLRIRLDGAQFWDVCEYVREKERESGSAWELADGAEPLSDSQVRRYIQRADRLILASVKEKRGKVLRRHLARRERMYGAAMNAGDVRTALAVLQDEARLRGLYPPTKTQLTGKGGAPLIPPAPEKPLTDDERQTAIASILARLGVSSN